MDPIWLFVALLLILFFAGISIVGALNRIREATEKTARLLEEHLAERAEPSRATDPSVKPE